MCNEKIFCPYCNLPLAPWEDYCSFCSGEDGDSPLLRKMPEGWCEFDDDRYKDKEDQDDEEEDEEIIYEESYTDEIETQVWGEKENDSDIINKIT